MTTIHDAYINALLADAAYAITQDVDSTDNLEALPELMKRVTPTLAKYISDNFFVMNSVDTGEYLGSGFDATVWQGKAGTEFAGKTYVSMKGTEGLNDFITDIDLTVSGAAKSQLVDMVNWWLKNTAAAGQPAKQIALAVNNGFVAAFVSAPTVLGTGILSDVSSVIVDGHSLGGHLATAFTRLFGGQAGWPVEHTYTYNSAGFTLTSDLFFKQIEALLGTGVSKGYFEGVVGQTNLFAENGINATTRTFLSGQEGLRTPLFNEESSFPINNHYMYKLTDALALGDAIAKLDSTFDTTKMNTLFDKGANKTEASLEGILDGLRKSILGDNITKTPIGDVSDSELSRKTFYENLKFLTDSATFKSLAGKVTLVAPPTSADEARSDLGLFLSLYHLTPFALKTDGSIAADAQLTIANPDIATQFKDDKLLTAEQIANGEANFSDMYLNDRAAMLSWVVKRNTEDVGLVLSTTGTVQGFEDKETETLILVGSGETINRNQYVFGSSDTNTLAGGNQADHLYGMSGDDTLNGGGGSDWLEGGADDDTLNGADDADTLYGGTGADALAGGAGNDKLYGGAGEDIYVHNTGDGNDVIVDSDGSGSIEINGLVITGGKTVENANNLWQSEDKRTRYAIYNESDGSKTLNIFTGSERIFVKKWEAGQLGINLEEPDTNPITPTPITSNHDSILVDIGSAMDGLAGNDVLKGASGEEKLYGGVGNDILFGRDGDDVLDGGSGDDILDGGAGHDVMFGGAGNDVIMSNNNYENIAIHEQSDGGTWQSVASSDENWRKIADSWTWNYEFGVPGNRLVYLNGYSLGFNAKFTSSMDPHFGFKYGNEDYTHGDVVYGGAGNDAIHGSEGSDYISGDEDDDVITAEGGDDIVLGGTGHDEVFGGDGNDYIDGESEDDNLIGGYGSDEVYGGLGSDKLIGDLPPIEGSDAPPSSTDYSQMGSDTLDGGSGNDELWGGGGADVLLGGADDDELVGDGMGTPNGYEGADFLDGGAGNDKLWGSGKGDFLYGRDGNDTVYGDAGSIPSADHGDDYIDGGSGDDLLFGQGGKDTIYGSDGNDTIFGDSDSVATLFHGDDYLDGGSGDDQLQGGGGADTILGDVGEDVLFGEDGDDNLNGGADSDQLDGGDGNDTLNGGAGADAIKGGDGNDILIGSGEGDILVGGRGIDTFYAGSGDIIVDQEGNENINLAGSSTAGVAAASLNAEMGGGAVNVSFGSGATLTMANGLVGFGDATYVFADGSSIKHSDLLGTSLNEIVNLQSEISMIFGGALNDTIFAVGTEGQTLFGGLGNDLLESSTGSDTLNGGAGNDILSGGIGNDLLNGEDGNDSLNGGEGSDILNGGLGANNLSGGVGNDTYIVGGNSDFVTESVLEGVDTVISSITYTLTSNVENLTLTGIGIIGGTGNEQDNTLIGNGAANILNGGTGNDILIGGEGSDVLSGDVGDDVMAGGVGDDVYTLAIGDGFDSIDDTQGLNRISFGADITRNTVHASQYQGDDGSYYLQVAYGTAGDKVAIKNGLAGGIQGYQFEDGTYISHAELIGNEGVPFHVYGTQNADTLVGTGSGDVIEGNLGDDVLLGLDGNDTLLGDSGSDTLIGGMGDDVLDGGLGHDQLEGGGGQDSYLMYWGMGKDIAIDGVGVEINTLQLDPDITLSDLDSKRIGDDLFINFKTTDEGIVLKDYYAGNQQWQISDNNGEITAIPDFLAISDSLSPIQKEFDNYEANIKANYYTKLGAEGFRLKSDGYFHKTTTEVINSIGYSSLTIQHYLNNFQTYTQLSNETDITRITEGEQYDGEQLYRNVTYSTVFSGSGSGNTFGGGGASGAGNGNTFIPNGTASMGTSINGAITGMTPTANGVWVSFTPNPSSSTGGSGASQNITVNSAYKTTTTLTLEKILGGESDDNIAINLDNNRLGTLAMIDGGDGSDTINFESEAILDKDDSDYFHSMSGDNNYGALLYGNSGNDILSGSHFVDTLIGGSGNDVMNGRGGADTYLFMAGDNGIDVINDTAYLDASSTERGYLNWYYTTLGISDWYDLYQNQDRTGIKLLPDAPMLSGFDYAALTPLYANGLIAKDTVEFGEGISFSDLSLSWGDKTLDINWGDDNGVKIAMPVHNQYSSTNSGYPDLYSAWIYNMKLGAGIEQFKFADGTIISMAEVLTHLPPVPSIAPIIFNVGDGNVIKETQWSNTIVFGAAVTPESLKVTHDGLDLIIKYYNGLDQLRILNWYADSQSQPEISAFFEFDSYGSSYLGTKWTADELYEMGLVVEGTNGNDILTSADGLANQLYGLDGNDIITGGAGNEEFYGGNDDDTMMGDAGNDFLHGGLGDDTLVGGTGDDTYYFSLGDGHEQIDNTATDSITAIDRIYLDSIDPAEVVLSRIANDLKIVINAENSITVKNYYLGTDSKVDQIQFYSYDAITDTYTDTIWDNAQIEVMATVAEINHAPTIIGSLSDVNVIDGNVLSMTLPADTLFEDADVGDQLTYTVTSADGSVLPTWLSFDPTTLSISGTPNGGDIGTLALQVTATDIAGTSAHINFNLSVAAMVDQVLTGTSGNDVLTGGSGNDTLNGLAGTDTMRGGYGDDNYYVERLADKVLEDANQGSDTINSIVTYTLSANIENLVLLGTASITANGNELDNQLTGNAGSNTLDGKTGKDQMVGGLGNDIYIVDDIGDVVTELENEGIDTVKSSVDYVLGNHVERLTLTGTEVINGTGNDLNNLIIGNDSANQISGEEGNDTLNGGLGADTLIGGLGNDIYVVDDALDTITEQVDAGTDTVQSSITYTLGDNLERLTLTGVEAIDGMGNALNNILVGNAASNTLSGLAGNDTITGGSSDDILIGGDGNDTLNGGLGADLLIGGLGNDLYTIDEVGDAVTEALNEGTDRVNSAINYVLGTHIENLTLTGTSAINGTGNELNNTITGNAADNELIGGDGNDSLNGGLGADVMSGGLGNDIYTVDNVNDIVVELDNEGIDRVNSSISYALGDYLENLTLTGSVDINGFGNQLSNVLSGNTGHNYLFGLDGNDTLTGNTGNDVLQGGEGADILNSNAGNDLLDGSVGADRLNGGTESDFFIGGLSNDTITTGTGYEVIAFNKGDGQDIINASTGADNTISLGGDFAYSDLSLTKVSNNLILKVSATDQITLKDWYLGTTNKSVVNLQVIAESIAGFSLGGADALRDNKVENFNFANMVAAFDAEGATANWQLTDERLTAHLQSGSDTAAIGGDLAYQYGKNSNLTGMGLLNTQSVIAAASFGQTAQTLNDPSVWQAEVVKLG
jgi:Ca2+-binding RTX toxin-like protein